MPFFMYNDRQYYVALDSEVFGPYSLNELLNLGIMRDTLISTSDDGACWDTAESYPELSHLFDSNETYSDSQESTSSQINQTIWKQKRKAALIGVLTLGLAGLSVMGVSNAWNSNIFAGTSLDQGGVGFVMKIISFLIVSVMLAIPFFIISLVRLIYYQIKLSSV